ncbi:Short-chain dehydrogenase/reductase SDR [Penicillium concentricum]|uniref:Short-chain dehydrogenase/reductase 3 n=1 Tax=Penicillium concentricum TaxID=293559 RepID=A0A9W9SRP4_9EURO|nr:Short-chain dehydrogenase/reductase SDR [Penicillium concentricum]KAJ5383407.1 Short-chain dehydrogenase/reductase SDR [Penicillium concentricum]
MFDYLNTSIITTLSVLISSLVLYYLHTNISERVLNNFQATEVWIPEDELVLLTGGSGGIGRQIMEELSRKKVRVVVLDINRPTFDLPENVTFYQTDITSARSLSETGAAIRNSHGEPTVIVNNAAVFHHGTILEMPEEKLRQTFDVNIISHFLILKEFLPYMVRMNRGHIVTVASVASFVTIGEMVDYACSKASALAFQEGLRQELKYWYKAPNVRTSSIHPLWVRTPMIEGFTRYKTDFRQPLLDPKEVSQAVVEHIVTRKSGQTIVPRHASAVGSLRALPLWMQEAMRSYFSRIVLRVRIKRIADENSGRHFP